MTTTSSLRLTKPTVGGDAATWATSLNSDMDYIDNAINGTANVNIAGLTSYTLVSDGSSSDQALCQAYAFSGALTGNCTVTLPANVKFGWAINNTTGGYSVILSAGGATKLTMSSIATWYFFISDGSSVSWPAVGFSSILAGAGGSFASSLGASGYQKLPGGLIIQWGTTITTTGGGNLALVSYPISFPSSVYNVVACNGDGGASSTRVNISQSVPPNKSNFTIVAADVPGITTIRVNWVAFGQ